jgi:secreted Zn-dependent insulinase-like peptidase
VVLISDPDNEYSAASMSVGVGSMNNPENMPGLAHFLEHMLFRGSKKYPEVDKFVD